MSMIDTLYYGIGFLVYIVFCIVTFDTYNKRKEHSNYLVLFMIYLYYTILASYVINLVDVQEGTMVRFLEVMVYAIAGGLFMSYHYKQLLEKDQKKFGNKEGSF